MFLKITGNTAHKNGYDAKPAEIVDVRYRVDGPKLIVLKEPGEHYWASRGTQGYSPARYAVYTIEKIMDDGRVRVDNVPVLDWPARATARDQVDMTEKIERFLKPR